MLGSPYRAPGPDPRAGSWEGVRCPPTCWYAGHHSVCCVAKRGRVTLRNSLLLSPAARTFFPSAFFAVFLLVWLLRVPRFPHAMSALVIVVVIAASCPKMASGEASRTVAHPCMTRSMALVHLGMVAAKSHQWLVENHGLAPVNIPVCSPVNHSRISSGFPRVCYLTLFVNTSRVYTF